MGLIFLVILALGETFCFIKLRLRRNMDRAAISILLLYLIVFILRIIVDFGLMSVLDRNKSAWTSFTNDTLAWLIWVTLIFFVFEMRIVYLTLQSDSM